MENSIALKLKELREKFDYSLQELAEQIGVAKQSIYKFENGIVNPSNETLLKISNVFNVSFSYFFESQKTYDVNFQNIKFREKDKIINTQFENEIKEDVSKYLAKIWELEEIMNERQIFENPLNGIKIESDKDIEKAAKTLRKRWKIGNAPIKDVIEILENKGLFIIEINRMEDFTGLCGFVNDNVPIIVLNTNCPTIERKRFTALHELGHLVLEFSDEISEKLVERFCDKFAGAILLVDETLYEELGKNRTVISLEELRRIKEIYGISIQAIIMRASNAGLIDNKTSQEWWNSYKEWSNDETKVKEFGNYQGIEKARRFKKLLVRGINEKRLSISKASELTGEKIDILKNKLLNELTFSLN